MSSKTDLDEAVVSAAHSSTEPLGSGEWFNENGIGELNSYPQALVTIKTDANCTLYIEFGMFNENGGISWDSVIPISIDGDNEAHDFQPYMKGLRPFRVRVLCGSQAMSYLRLHTEYGHYPAPPTSSLKGIIPKNFPAIITRSVALDTDVALGRFAGRQLINKFGKRDGITTSTDNPADITNVAAQVYTGQPAIAIAAAETVEVFSAEAADTNITFDITGIDINGLLVTEELSTDASDGTTPAVTTTEFYRVFTIDQTSATVSTGAITFRHTSTTANIFALLAAGATRSRIAAFTVPINASGLLKKVYASIIRGNGASAVADMQLSVRRYQQAWQPRRFFGVSADGPAWNDEIHGGLLLPPLADVKLTTTLVSATTDISGGFDIELHYD